MSKPTTDDEVLALAEKIKQQRSIDAKYAKAAEKLSLLKHDIDNGAIKIRYGVSVKFETIQPNGYMTNEKVCLPEEMANDLIQFCQNYIAEKNSE